MLTRGTSGAACSLYDTLPAPARRIIILRAALKLMDAAQAALDESNYGDAIRYLSAAAALCDAAGAGECSASLSALIERVKRAASETERITSQVNELLADAARHEEEARKILSSINSDEAPSEVARKFIEAAGHYDAAARDYARALTLLGYSEDDVEKLVRAHASFAEYESLASRLPEVYGNAAPIARAAMEAASLAAGLREAARLVDALGAFSEQVNYAVENNVYDPAFLVNAARSFIRVYDDVYAAALSMGGPGRDALSSTIANVTKELDNMIRSLADEYPKAAIEIVKGIESASTYYKPPPIATSVPEAAYKSVKALGEIMYSAAKALHDYLKKRLPVVIGDIVAGVVSAIPYAAAFIVMTPAAIEYLVKARISQLLALSRGDVRAALEKEKEVLQSMIPKNLGELIGMALLVAIGDAIARAAKTGSISRLVERIPRLGELIERLREHPIAPRLARVAGALRAGARVAFTAIVPELEIARRSVPLLRETIRTVASRLTERLKPGEVRVKTVSIKYVTTRAVKGAFNAYVRGAINKFMETIESETIGVKGIEGDIRRAIEATIQRIKKLSDESPALAAEQIVKLQSTYEYIRSRISEISKKLEASSSEIREIANRLELEIGEQAARRLRDLEARLESLEKLEEKLGEIERLAPGAGEIETRAIPEAEKIYREVTGKAEAPTLPAKPSDAVKTIIAEVARKTGARITQEDIARLAKAIEEGRVDDAMKVLESMAETVGAKETRRMIEAYHATLTELRALEAIVRRLKTKHPDAAGQLDHLLSLVKEGRFRDALTLAETLAGKLGAPELARTVEAIAAGHYLARLHLILNSVREAIREKKIEATRAALQELGAILKKVNEAIESIVKKLRGALPSSLLSEYIRLREEIGEMKIELPRDHPLARYFGPELKVKDIPIVAEWLEKNASKLTPRELVETAKLLSEVAATLEGMTGKVAAVMSRAEAVASLIERARFIAERYMGDEWGRVVDLIENGRYEDALRLAEELGVDASMAAAAAELATTLEAIARYMGSNEHLLSIARVLRSKAVSAALSSGGEVAARLDEFKKSHPQYADKVDAIKELLAEGRISEAIEIAETLARATRDYSVLDAVQTIAKDLGADLPTIVADLLGPGASDIVGMIKRGDVGRAAYEIATRAMKGEIPIETALMVLRDLGAERYADILRAYEIVSRNPDLAPAARYLAEMNIADAVAVLERSTAPEAVKALELLRPLLRTEGVVVEARLVKYGQVAEYLERIARLAPRIQSLLRQAAEALRNNDVKTALELLKKASYKVKADDVTSRAALLNAVDMIVRSLPSEAKVFGEIAARIEKLGKTRELTLEELVSLMKEFGVKREIELNVNGEKVKAVRTAALSPDGSLIYEVVLYAREKPVAGYELVARPGAAGEVVRAETWWVDPDVLPEIDKLGKAADVIARDVYSLITHDPLLEKLQKIAPVIETEVKKGLAGIRLPPWFNKVAAALPPERFFQAFFKPPSYPPRGVEPVSLIGYVHENTAVVMPLPKTTLIIAPDLVEAIRVSLVSGVPSLRIELTKPVEVAGVKVSTILIPNVIINTNIIAKIMELIRSKAMPLEITITSPRVGTAAELETVTVHTTGEKLEAKERAPLLEEVEVKPIEVAEPSLAAGTPTSTPPSPPPPPPPRRGGVHGGAAGYPGAIRLTLSVASPKAPGATLHVRERLMV